MTTIFDPFADGYGVISFEGGLTVLAAFLLLSCIHPGALLAARLSAIVAGRVPRRGHDAASAMSLTSGTISRGLALMPGYLLFLLFLLSTLLGTSAHPVAFAGAMPDALVDPRLLAAAALGLAAFSGVYDSAPASWGLGPLGAGGRYFRLAAIGAFLVGCALTLDPAWALSLLACSIGTRIAALLAGRAFYLEGAGGILLAPSLLTLWIIQTLVVAHVGPIERLLRLILEQPGADGITLGLARENALDAPDSGATLCTTLDCVEAMKLPR